MGFFSKSAPKSALGQLSALVDVVRTDTGEARVNACGALTSIAFAEENKREMFQNEILMSALVDVVRTDTGQARVKACVALSNISGASSNHLDMASNASLRSTLVALAKDESAGEARIMVIKCIAKLSRSASTAPILLGADILPTMMDVVRKAGPDLSKWGKDNSSESWALIFLTNIAQADAAVPVLRVKKIYDLLAPLATQDHYQALKACATLAFVVGGEEDGPTFELLKRSPAATGQLVDLLKNTLNLDGGRGYTYNVYPLHSPLNAVKVLSRSDGFKDFLLSKEVFPLLHRELAEYVEGRGGGSAGGGGDDLESACIAIFALFELSHPPSSSSSSATASLEYALSTVATYSDASLTPLVSLLTSFIEKATAAVGTVFYNPTPAIATADSLLTRLNAAKSTAAVEKSRLAWKGVAARRQSRRQSGTASSEPEKKEESQVDSEMAAQLLEAQRLLQEQQEKEKLQRAAEKKALADHAPSQDAASNAEATRLAKIKEDKEASRDRDTQNQLEVMMKMLTDLTTKQDRTLSSVLSTEQNVLEIKATVNETLQSLSNFFTRESDGVPRFILMGPPSSDFAGSVDGKLNQAMAAMTNPTAFAKSFMLQKKTATIHILCAHDLSSVVSFDITEPNKYVKLKKFLTVGDGAKMKKIEAAMSKVGCKDGSETWVSNKNIDAFLQSVEGSSAKRDVGDYEVEVRKSISLPPPPRSLLERARAVFEGIRGEDAPAALSVKEVVAACEEELGLEAEGGMKARIEVLEQNV
ncbi:hypothetical protein TeGR_g4627 [Tetraparma gracilis]|uniref:Armadillo-type protein n=1 Tax=Tetraparma gracilis TaxID=2962635 RepID=A0ABQ6MFC5_9STRA|nr:hypothetical protein TeGR_g4627 [Tetraparma gracilis]